METGRKADGVLVVERGDGAAFAREFLPTIVALADVGLRGDRNGVLEVLRRLRADLTLERTVDRADVIAMGVADMKRRRAGMRLERTAFVDDGDIGDLIEKLDLVMHRAEQAANAERDGRPSTVDVLLGLHNVGTISYSEYLAGLELRAVGEVMATSVAGAPAIDYARVRVDGGKGWSEPELSAGFVDHPAAERVLGWSRYVRAHLPSVGGRNNRTPVEVIWQVVGRNVPLRDVDRTSGCRKGTAARVVKAGLGLYVAMNGAELPKCS